MKKFSFFAVIVCLLVVFSGCTKIYIVPVDSSEADSAPASAVELTPSPDGEIAEEEVPSGSLPPIVEVSLEGAGSYSPASCFYTVQPGDSFSKISSQFTGTERNFSKVMKANGRTSSGLFPGERLGIPADLLSEEFKGCQAPLEKPEAPATPMPEPTPTPSDTVFRP